MIYLILMMLAAFIFGWGLGRWPILVWVERELDKVRQGIADSEGTAKENWLAAHKAVADLESALRKRGLFGKGKP